MRENGYAANCSKREMKMANDLINVTEQELDLCAEAFGSRNIIGVGDSDKATGSDL